MLRMGGGRAAGEPGTGGRPLRYRGSRKEAHKEMKRKNQGGRKKTRGGVIEVQDLERICWQ